MEGICGNAESSGRDFGDSSKLTNWILYSGATCNIPSQVSYFIPCLLEDTNKYIEVADGQHATANQKGHVQIKNYGDNGDTFIVTHHNVLLALDL